MVSRKLAKWFSKTIRAKDEKTITGSSSYISCCHRHLSSVIVIGIMIACVVIVICHRHLHHDRLCCHRHLHHDRLCCHRHMHHDRLCRHLSSSSASRSRVLSSVIVICIMIAYAFICNRHLHHDRLCCHLSSSSAS